MAAAGHGSIEHFATPKLEFAQMQDGSTLRPRALRKHSCRSLRILYHHRTRSADGQSIHIDGLIGALRAAGHNVEVVGPNRISATEEPLSGRVLPRFVHELLECGYNLVEFCKLLLAVARHRPDGLYQRANVFMLSGAWLARLFRLPYLLEVNAPLVHERSKFTGMAFPRFGAWTERRAWLAADRILPVTAVLARHLESAGVPRARIRVTPNGIDLENLKPIDSSLAKQRLGLSDHLVLGFVGFVREWHGLEQAIDLLALEPALSNACLLVVGDGPACPSIRSRARGRGVESRVVITGVVPHARLAELVSAMDIALQPEVTPYASPLKLFEYMALGRAIVAPDSENIREILEHGADCLLFRMGDCNSLADKIRNLAVDAELRKHIGAAAAAKILQRDLTWKHNAEKIAALIEELSRPDAAHVPASAVF